MRLRKRLYLGAVALRRRMLGLPEPGAVNFGDLRRLEPISRRFGEDRAASGELRGRAIDRHYIEAFLAGHAGDIRGRVLEVGEPLYTRRYGGDRVEHSEVLHVRAGNPLATVVADLADAPSLADSSYDCAIVTQTLHLIHDVSAAARTLARVLKPSGTLLMTVPGITPVPNGSDWGDTWHWALTEHSVRKLLRDAFKEDAEVATFGNVLTATAFLHGLSVGELSGHELEACDRDFPVIIGARVSKQA
ncbi:MAG: class I SAM-dependent methyltransferase [Steroidobacteraceae bacterium]